MNVIANENSEKVDAFYPSQNASPLLLAAEKSKGIGVCYIDARKAGHVVALSGLVKGGVMSGVLRRIDAPGSPVKGFQKRQTDTAQFACRELRW